MARKNETTIIEESSGNVFADLGLPDAEEMLVKAQLAGVIQDVIELRDLTQVQAAALMGIDQPKVSKIMRGRLSEFSTERLLHFLIHLGLDVEILVHRQTSPARREGAISVAYV